MKKEDKQAVLCILDDAINIMKCNRKIKNYTETSRYKKDYNHFYTMFRSVALFKGIFLLLITNTISQINYVPDYTDEGYLNVNQLNSAIRLSALQYDGENNVDLIIPKGVYYIPNNKTINLTSYVNLKCDSVIFIYKHITDDYTQNIIEINNISHSGIKDLTIDFSGAYNDKRSTYSNADKFVNRSIIQIEHSDSIIIENITIKKILGSGIELSHSWNCQVKNCNISDSWVFGNESGTQGYAIDIVGTMCKNNIIVGNTLSNTRHLIVAQYGCAFNVIAQNKTSGAKALKKVFFIEFLDKNFTYDITLHGNSPHDNIIIENECEGNLYLDNIKITGNGPNNQILNNIVKGRLVVESKSPYYDYNSGQVIKGNKFGSLRIEAENCINENNIKLK